MIRLFPADVSVGFAMMCKKMGFKVYGFPGSVLVHTPIVEID